jgi:hypothetical protein
MAENRELINLLESRRDGLPPRDQSFADSLLSQFNSRRTLSPKQWYWVEKLSSPALPAPPEPQVVPLQNFERIFDLFTTAQKHLKHPKIRFSFPQQEIQLQVAGSRSKYEGKVMVTDGQPFGVNQWYGHIDSLGNWTMPAKYPVPKIVYDILHALSKDPEKAAKEYGLLTGNCCFCHKKLKDERSTHVGYGPVCAKNFGLLWGKKELRAT